MGARNLSGALAALVCLASPAAAQDAGPGPEALDRAAWETHRACVASERALRFLRHYERADASERAAVVVALEKLRPAPAGSSWVVGIDALRRAESVLADESGLPSDDAAAIEIDELAGALDLVVLPGCFEARKEGLGDPITVLVRRTWATQAKNDFVLSLEWRSPSGEVVHARREPVGAGAVGDQGFEMYLRAPLSPPSSWSLYGLVTREGSALGGVVSDVRVDCVEKLRERTPAALGKDLPDQPGLLHLRVALDRLLRSGRRVSTALGANEMLAAIESWSESGPRAATPVPIELVYTDPRSVEHWLWSYSPSAEPRGALVLLAPATETPDFALSGELGARWIELAERRGVQLFALHLPPEPARVAPLLERLRQWVDGRELVVVARGDALGRLQLGLEGRSDLPFDAVAISALISGAKPDSLFASKPRLVIAPGAASASAKDYIGVDGAPFPLLNEPELPQRVATWLEALDAARAEPERGK